MIPIGTIYNLPGIYMLNCSYSNYRKHFLEIMHPQLCQLLEKQSQYFGNGTSCHDWEKNIQFKQDKNNDELIEALYEYAKENLARVRIMIRNPYVQKISRDQAMTFTNYVANTGGLLGLCLGSSFLSFFEIFYHCILKLYKQ